MFERYTVIDADTHITEPPDTWTGRVASKWGDDIPHIERIDGFDVWVIAGKPWAKPGNTAMAGFDGVLPDGPATYEDMHPAAWDPKARVAFMDEQNIDAQVLYPNIGGFGGGSWLNYRDPAFALDCVRGYNDFQTDFALDRSRAAAADGLASLLGHRALGRRDRARGRARPPRHQLLQPAGRLRPAGALATATGTRSGPRRRTPGCRSTSISAAGASESSWTPGGELGFGRTSRGSLAAVRRQPAVHRRPDPRRRLPPVPAT